MSITSFQFLGFVLVTLIAFRLFPAKKQWWVMLAASVVFYLSFSVGGIFFMIGTSLLTYFAALKIQKYKDTFAAWMGENKKTADKETRKAQKALYQKKQKLIVFGVVFAAIAILFLCKYYKVLAVDFNNLFNTKLWTAENILLPLGISYYSLQLIGYLVDVHRDIIPAERNPLKVILYGGFFLSIMQGPFNRYNDLMPQICAEERKKLTYTDFKFAVLRIVGGYIKKLCIADQVGRVAGEVFTNYDKYEGLGIIYGIVCFAVQLYADFSGYMDIIVGIGQLFGIKMPENFRQPFFSRNMSEFWKRWHITLGLWLQDYVFYPMLKSRRFKNMGKGISNKLGKEAGRRIPTYIGMFILWTLIGAWHGAGFNYVFGVGILQFLYIFLGEICNPLFEKLKKGLHINDKKLYWRIFQSVRCTVLMMFAWVFFNSDSFADAIGLLKRIPAVPNFSQITEVYIPIEMDGFIIRDIIFLAVCIIALFVLDLIHEKGLSLSSIISNRVYPVRLIFYLVLVFTIIIFGSYGDQYVASNFIYFEF